MANEKFPSGHEFRAECPDFNELSVRSAHALHRLGYRSRSDIERSIADGVFPPKEPIGNFGQTSINEVMNWLRETGPAKPLSVNMKRTTVRQRRGPTLKFSGALIAKCEFTMRNGHEMRFEIYQTAGGALIPVSISDLETRAEVIEPGNEMEMRFAVMDFFDWNERARSMVKEQLKWRLVQEVE